MSSSTRAALATTAVAASGFAPWARSGDLRRSGWALAGAARDAGLAGGPVAAAVALGAVALPLLASVAWLAAATGRRAVAAGCALAAAVLGTAAAGLVLGSDVVEPAWGLLAGVAAAAAAAAAGTTLAGGRASAAPAGVAGARRTPAVVAGAVAVAASLVFAAVTAPATPGSADPEAAVRAALAAAGSEDVLGVMGALAPAEREPLRSSLVRLARELRRLDLVSSQGSLARAGVSVDVDDVGLEVTPLGPGRAAVRMTGGRVATRLDPAGRSLAAVLAGLAGSLGVPLPPAPGDGTVVVAVREHGRWYVSFWASVAEASAA